MLNASAGVAVGTGAAVHLSNSVLSHNANYGVGISGGGINIDGTTIAFNGTGVWQTGGGVNLSNDALSFNNVGVVGTVNSYRNNRFTNNGPGGTIVPIGGASDPSGLQ